MTTTRARRGKKSGCGLVCIQALKPCYALAGMVVGGVVKPDVERFAPENQVYQDRGRREYALFDFVN